MLLGSRPDVLEADEPEREAPRSAKLEGPSVQRNSLQ